MDLGSNSFKMTVAQWAPDSKGQHPFRVLHKERHPVQLGRSVFAEGRISAEDFREGYKAIAKMQERLRDFSAPILRVVATSAIRDSGNGRDFVNQVRDKLGIPVDVITGTEEARLISRGLEIEYPGVKRGALVDIGGGSTEIASFGSGWKEPTCHSFKVGSVRLATNYFGKNKANLESEAAARKTVASILKVPPPKSIEKLVGSAGAIQSLGKILSRKNPQVIKRSILDQWIQLHVADSHSSLEKEFELQPSRARVIVPGAIVLSEVLKWLGQEEIIVTGMTLRDGLMVDLVNRWRATESKILKGSGLPSKVTLTHGADREMLTWLEETASRFRADLSHSSHITQLSLSIYDQLLAQGFRFHTEERRILLAAAYLHDIGKMVAESGHQRHGSYIVSQLKIPGFSTLDVKKIAAIIFHHRKDPPPKKGVVGDGLRGVHANQVRHLCAILRMADGLDEGHEKAIRSLKLSVSRKQMLLEIRQARSEPRQLDYFRDKASYFEEIFGTKIVSFVQYKPS